MTDWIEWNGGVCPVAGEATVDVKFRPFAQEHPDSASAQAQTARHLRWDHDKSPGDILAYRLVEPSKLPEGNRDAPPIWAEASEAILAGAASALSQQVAGTHYKECKIQPVEFSEANKLQYLEGSIVARAARHDKATGKGAEDIRKIIHEAQLLLQLRYGEVA